MYHISDLKKYNRCPRLYANDTFGEKPAFHHFVRLDEEVTQLAVRKLGIKNYYLGEKNDPGIRALTALKTYDWLVKARFEYKGLRVKVPFIHKASKGYDVYFLFVGLFPHADDMQFYCNTIWVLEGLGIHIRHIRIIHLNASYVRKKKLNPSQLFIVSDYFYNAKNNPTIRVKEAIYANMRDPSSTIHSLDEFRIEELPEPVRTKKCTGRQKCNWYDRCFPSEEKLPNNSILTLAGCAERYNMQKEGIEFLKDADINRIEGTRIQFAQIAADRNGGLFVDKAAVRSWLSTVSFPITFIDFEWECYAIPPYIGMKPYDVLPFEYSLHIMEEDGTVTHKVFLSVHDDRREMVETMIREIPKSGSLVAYNAEGAEKHRLREFAELFPEYSEQLLDMEQRMRDMQIPFMSGLVYDTRMAGVWTLKKIMSIMNDKDYNDLAIHQGMDAVYQWRHLDKNDEDVNHEKIIQELKDYCGMDTYALTVVYRWLNEICRED